MAFGQRQAFIDASAPPVDESPNHLAALLKLAEALKAPDSVRKQIADLDRATQAHKAAEAAAVAAQAKSEREIEQAQRQHQEKIDRETAASAKVIATERAAAEADRKAAAAERATAARDAQKAAELKAEIQRRIRVMEGAAA